MTMRPRPGARGAGSGLPNDPFLGDPFQADPFRASPGPASEARRDPRRSESSADDALAADLAPHWAPSDNPLIRAAHPLLTLVTQLRGTVSHDDPAALREELARAVTTFEREATSADVARESIIGARYLLCTFVDETASGTPWGGQGTWATDTLLVRFHNETRGGEKSFQLLAKLAEDPARHRMLLELFALCLALGFEGRYRIEPNGRAQLDQLRERLHQLLRGAGAAVDTTLSSQWRAATVSRQPWLSAAPFWVVGTLALAAALGSYLYFSAALAARSDRTFAAVSSLKLGAEPRKAVVDAAPAIPARPRLAVLLADEIRQGLLTVDDGTTRSIVVLKGDLSFDAGSATVSARMQPVLDKVGRALAALRGDVLVTGHTDAAPIRTARFPSNWHLSRDRAEAVRSVLAQTVPGARLKSEGKADAEPLSTNETPAGRADNRRVEVTLFVAP